MTFDTPILQMRTLSDLLKALSIRAKTQNKPSVEV